MLTVRQSQSHLAKVDPMLPRGVVCCFQKTSLNFTDLLTVSPLGEVSSRRAAEVGSIEADEAGKKLVAPDHAFIGGGALFWCACAGSIGSAEGSHEVTGDQGGFSLLHFFLMSKRNEAKKNHPTLSARYAGALVGPHVAGGKNSYLGLRPNTQTTLP
ncbi:MAG: hypothetical protein KBC57_06975 [Neisseriaceae bacterium]|nr:hypothetical protein [Neisseriaceae bacterium]